MSPLTPLQGLESLSQETVLSRLLSQQMAHPLLAQATAKWDWDGTIPDRQTKGLSVTKGSLVDICKVVDADWFQVHHQNSCKYIPRAFLDVTRVYEERFRSQFHTLAGHDLKIVDPKILPASSPPESKRGLLAHLYRRRFNLANLPKPNTEVPRPIIPPAPFLKECISVDHDTSPVRVGVDCKEINPSQTVVTFDTNRCFTVFTGFEDHCPGRRLHSFLFQAMLPDGYMIAGLDPENYISSLPMEVQERYQRKDGLWRPVFGQADLANTVRRATAELMEPAKYTVRGGGVGTNHANWVVAEDARSESGLPKSFQFSLLLPTDRVPPTIKYMINLEWEAVTENDKTLEGSPITESWKSEWVEVELSTRSPGVESLVN